MLFRLSQIGCIGVAVAVSAMSAQAVQAQYPFSGHSCGNGYGAMYGQSGYGQPGIFQNQGGNFGSNYYAPGNYGPPTGYAPQQSMGYGGYARPALNLNQSFYPSGYGYGTPAPVQNYPAHHTHHSHHAWHPGHYLLGHH